MTKPIWRPPTTKLFNGDGSLKEDELETDERLKEIKFKVSRDLLIDARKKMFKSNVSPQEFFSFMLLKLTLDDDKALNLLKESSDFSKRPSTKLKKEKNPSKLTSDDLYEFFEQEDRKIFQVE